VRRERAALRDFDPANGRCGSTARITAVQRQRPVHLNQRTLTHPSCAPMQVSQKSKQLWPDRSHSRASKQECKITKCVRGAPIMVRSASDRLHKKCIFCTKSSPLMGGLCAKPMKQQDSPVRHYNGRQGTIVWRVTVRSAARAETMRRGQLLWVWLIVHGR
jgi:hypothetical protein